MPGTFDKQMRSVISVGIMFVLLLSISYLLPGSVKGEEIIITDEAADVLRTGYVDMEIGGNEEIDILSLSSSESIGDVTVKMECADDITDEVGYLYTITISGIHVSYQDGLFKVWRMGSETQPVDNVQTGIAGKEITIVLKKTTIGSEMIMNATTQYYALDWTKGATTESYYDMVGEFRGGAGSAVGDYTRTYEDDDDDVRVIFLDERSSDEDGLDIISLSIDLGSDIELRLELEDAPIFEGSASYTVYLGKSKVVWSDGSGHFHPEDEGKMEIDSDLEENIIRMILPGEYFGEGIGGVIVQSRWDLDENTFIQDLLPDDPYAISELLPFPPGSRRELNIEIRAPDNVIMERVYSDFPAQAKEDIRSSIDSNDDGEVDTSEMDDFIVGLEADILSSGHEGDLSLDNKVGDMELTIDHSGIIGSVGSSSEIEIQFILEFSFQTSDVWDHAYEVEIAYFQPGVARSLRFEEDEIEYIVTISVIGEWEIDPLTIEPAEMSNYLTAEGNTIEFEMTGEDAREFDPGSVSFGLRVKDAIDDDDDVSGEEDYTWLYVVILVVMIVIVIGLLLWYRREE